MSHPRKSPYALNGHRLNAFRRAVFRLGIKPWRRCPDGNHDWENLYGDAIIAMNFKRAVCWYCWATSPSLMEVNDDPD